MISGKNLRVIERIGYYYLYKKLPPKETRMPRHYASLPKKRSRLILDSINFEKKLNFDLIQEGKEILEFGDDIKNIANKGPYIFENKHYTDLVNEFLIKNRELKKEGKVDQYSSISLASEPIETPKKNKKNYRIPLKKEEEEEEEDDTTEMSGLNAEDDKNTAFFGLILNLKS